MSDEYDEKSSQIRQLASLPGEQLVDHLSDTHSHITSVAPNIAPHIFGAANNALQYLNSKLPHMGNEHLQDQIPGPSPAQKSTWLNLHETVNDPVSVLEHVNRGTLNSSHLEALQTVYPDLHQEMIQKMMGQLGEMKQRGETLPYAKRVSVSKFIGQSLDSTMTVASMQAIQNANAGGAQQGPEAQASSEAKKGSQTELSQINKVTSLYQTPLQSRETKKLQKA